MKDQLLDKMQNDPKNWITKKCSHCGDSYKYNVETGREDEFSYCDDCYKKIIHGD